MNRFRTMKYTTDETGERLSGNVIQQLVTVIRAKFIKETKPFLLNH